MALGKMLMNRTTIGADAFSAELERGGGYVSVVLLISFIIRSDGLMQ